MEGVRDMSADEPGRSAATEMAAQTRIVVGVRTTPTS
jgi:hypothetical protein